MATVALWPAAVHSFDWFQFIGPARASSCGDPQLEVISTTSYWQSFAAFQTTRLTVDFAVANNDAGAAYKLTIVDVVNSGGVVTMDSGAPKMVVDEISGGGVAHFHVDFQVPPGVAYFKTHADATVEDSCGTTYPVRDSANTSGVRYRPPVNVTWQLQLQGNVNSSYPAEIYDIDLFDSSESLIDSLQASGKKVNCYFSAGSYEKWRSDASEFSPDDLGSVVAGWEDERWLDIRSANVRRIMQNRLEQAKQKGCDGVDPDNMDGYANSSGFDLSAADQLAFNRFIAGEAHERGLSVGLKNDLDQVIQLVDYFDFSVNEQCHEFDECGLLAPFINRGKPVLNVEYQEDLITNNAKRRSLCDAAAEEDFSTLILPVQLDDAFRYSCP
jgi:hypothetical protein